VAYSALILARRARFRVFGDNLTFLRPKRAHLAKKLPICSMSREPRGKPQGPEQLLLLLQEWTCRVRARVSQSAPDARSGFARLLCPSANARRPVIRFAAVFLRADFDRYSQEWLATCEPHTADRLPIEWALKLQRHTVRLSPIVDEIQICHKPAFLSRCPRIISKRQVAAISLGL